MDVTTDDTAPFDAAEALLKSWTTDDATPEKEKPSETPEANEDPEAGAEGNEQTDKQADEDATPSDDEVQDEQGEDEGKADDEDEGQGEDKSYVDSDDVFVKVKVDGEDREFAIKDLKRLAGQEASLTRKSQEVAVARKTVDEQTKVHQARLDTMLDRARKAWEPYSKINLLVAAKTLEADQLQALQQEMQAKWDDLQFIEKEGQTLAKQITEKTAADKAKAAQECIKVLSDPTTGIEGWSEKVYTDLCAYAKEQGIPADYVNDLTDPIAFKLIQKAMLFDQGKAKVTQAKDKAAKANKNKTPPKKIVKSSQSGQANKDVLKPSKPDDAMKKLRNTGDRDDAAEALLAMWGAGSDE
jgi:hypothetical protein